MHIVTVEFIVEPGRAADFRAAMIDNARASREREAGCSQFDVCTDVDDPATIFLYEVYDDRAAFEVHLASAHFKSFDLLVKPWIRRKTVRTYLRLDAD